MFILADFVTRSQIEEAVAVIRSRTRHQPEFGLVLGSGLGALAEAVQDADTIPFADIPHFPVSAVVGHKSRLIIGRLEDRSVLVMQGRVHYYEGYSAVETAKLLQIKESTLYGHLHTGRKLLKIQLEDDF